ncbi:MULTISPECIES: ASCH domain-containing protein [Asticcacaulis]|uniref:ASCH domain-containing protein n=1 Tax=Asticcacaulis TaxID=76890 RepID=UPI001AE95BF5|nr:MULTISPECIES: ASCH domain-containing protein [Asticcacaulis]MBP2161250.1 putative transcriptional regulator [Asticcacaulis solisilvae]MDR6802384.1 putative transcriptional regulator [Asticcacaulis sp. BE141]
MILLSLQTRFADAIYSGRKRQEFRRRPPRRGIPGLALIYETKPTGMVTGMVRIDGVIAVPTGQAANLAFEDDPYRDYYDRYLEGAHEPVALMLGPPVRFVRPQPLMPLTGLRLAPQSFCYVDSARPEITALLHPESCRSSVAESEDE